MNYPVYKEKKLNPLKKIMLITLLIGTILCFVLPWYVYVQASMIFIAMSIYMFKKYKGFRMICGLTFSIMFLLFIIDFVDQNVTWSLDYVLPSFMIFLTTLMFTLVLFKKRKWSNYYSMHVYFILLSLIIGAMMVFGIMESIVMGIVTLSIFATTLIAIWIRVGKNYHRNLLKFIHL